MKQLMYVVVKLILVLLFQASLSITYAETLTVGSLSSRPASEIRRFQPLIDYLSLTLKAEGVDEVNLHIASSIDEMTELMRSGQVGLYMDSPVPSMALVESGASRIVLRRWKKGVKEYHSVIFVHKDSGINSIHDLKGRIMGFEEVFSTSSYYLPKASMQQEGVVLTEKPDRHAVVPANEVGYIFSDDDRNTITWVRKKRIAAGAVNNIKFDELKDKFKKQLKIIYRSVKVPRQVVNFSTQLSPATAGAVKAALLDMDKTDRGKAYLETFEKTTKFDEFHKKKEKAMAPLKLLAESYH